jgi:hypothetical protein
MWQSFTKSNPADISAGTRMVPRKRYIIASSGELLLEDGSKHAVGSRRRCVALSMSGRQPSRTVAVFAAAMFTQTFDNMMLPPKTHVLGTPNRNPAPRTDRR